ncbi:hypothetical protein LRS10_22870 [Phenylobacterium sp. J426]|nr:hypothetical protein [Phenylobacterium sp. J426]MCR5876748.1 hypothetical protein [Phenylobacterium sp. J426]
MDQEERGGLDRRTFNTARLAILAAFGGVAVIYATGVAVWVALGFKLS